MNANPAHPLLACAAGTYLDLLRTYGCDRDRLPRALAIGMVVLLRQPLALAARLRYQRRLAAQVVTPDPLFLIGHWRSGTTHLQNLLNQDPQFGRVPLLQAALPQEYLLLPAWARRWLGRALPATRLMDNMPVSADAPWEEELALAATCRYCFYHVSSFPRQMERIFREAVLFAEAPADAPAVWWEQTHAFLRQVQFTQPGRRLLLKNPANTARVGLLRAHFPQARFLHLHRHPYEVFASTVHLYLRAQAAWGLQATSRDRVVAHVLDSAPRLLHAWFEQRRGLAPNRVVEVRFDDLQARPLACLERIYTQLELDGFAAAVPRFAAYLDSQKDYRKNQLTLSAAERAAVAERWADLFDTLGYAP